jgi:hypothetical protein
MKKKQREKLHRQRRLREQRQKRLKHEDEHTRIHRKTSCPACGYTFDSASNFDKDGPMRMPGEGDPSLCIQCTSYLVYTADQSVRLVDRETWDEWPDALKGKLALHARALETLSREKPKRQIDATVSRGPDDWRAAMTLKDGTFVVSRKLSSRQAAKREIAAAKSMMGVAVRVVEVQGLWYGDLKLHVFDTEVAVFKGKAPFKGDYFGPYVSEASGYEDMFKRARLYAKEIGMPNVVGIQHIQPSQKAAQN